MHVLGGCECLENLRTPPFPYLFWRQETMAEIAYGLGIIAYSLNIGIKIHEIHKILESSKSTKQTNQTSPKQTKTTGSKRTKRRGNLTRKPKP
jgi:hypothetical protein